jgi:hypothetical protein
MAATHFGEPIDVESLKATLGVLLRLGGLDTPTDPSPIN